MTAIIGFQHSQGQTLFEASRLIHDTILLTILYADFSRVCRESGEAKV
jgi:hypothetical protein